MLRSVILLWAVFLGMSLSAVAADDSPAMTKLSEVDADFAYQGEYSGLITTGPTTWEEVGLQVVALGHGEFSAILYSGGLPGAGYNKQQNPKFNGQLEGNRVVFSKYPTRITVDGSSAVISDDRYSSFEQGRLNKVMRSSTTIGAPAPYGATVLFDGTGTEHFENGQIDENGWLVEGTQLKDTYRNFTLHLEFRLPYMPTARDQGRSNSGVYLQSRYEVQILDSFGLDPVYNNCGALYKQRPADVNMALPPLTWQTYDIDFAAPKFDANGEKIQNAKITVRHNGVVIHNDVDITAKTGGGSQEGPNLLPIKLQNHRNPIRFRNIWIVDHGNNPPPKSAPCYPSGYDPCQCCLTVCE